MLTIIDGQVEKIKASIPHTQINGCVVYKKDIDGTLIFAIKVNGNASFEAPEGYSFFSEFDANKYRFGIADTELDLSQYTQNFLIEPYHPNDETGFEGSQLFYRDRKPAYIDRLLLYANSIDSPCLEKTLKYCDIDYLTDDNGNIIVEENGITLIQP